jgi:hypothetical protein
VCRNAVLQRAGTNKVYQSRKGGGKEMKKLTVLWLAGLLVLAFGATGYAQPKLDFKASGAFWSDSYLLRNTSPYNGAGSIYQIVASDLNPNSTVSGRALNRKYSYLDMRAHLKFDAVMEKGLSGTMYFEIDTSRWGTASNTFASTREAATFGSWTTDRTAVEVKNIYVDIGLPYFGIPGPMTVRVGAQPLAIRPAFFLYSDGMGIQGGIQVPPVSIIPYYYKALEGVDWTADDVDVYGLQAIAKISTVTIGAYGMYYNMNTFPFQVLNPAVMPVPGVTGGIAGIMSQNPGTMCADMWWLGFYADGKAGPVNFNFDFIYDNGKVESRQSLVPDVKYRGWATRAKVDYPWEKFNFGVVGMYASGADANKTGTSGLPGSTTATGGNATKVGSYVVPPGSEMAPINSESVVTYSIWAGASGGAGVLETSNYNQMSRGAFGGSWFAKLYGSAKVTPWYKVTLQGLYIGDTTKHGNTWGTAVKPGTSTLRDDNDIGFELDIINDISLYKNLTFSFAGGYLWAGDAMDLRQTGVSYNISPKNPWAVRTRLQYLF